MFYISTVLDTLNTPYNLGNFSKSNCAVIHIKKIIKILILTIKIKYFFASFKNLNLVILVKNYMINNGNKYFCSHKKFGKKFIKI